MHHLVSRRPESTLAIRGSIVYALLPSSMTHRVEWDGQPFLQTEHGSSVNVNVIASCFMATHRDFIRIVQFLVFEEVGSP